MQKRIADFRSGINRKLHENLTALNSAEIAYNFDFNGGSLKCGLPFQPFFNTILASFGLNEQILGIEGGFGNGAVFFYERYDFLGQKPDDKLILVDANFNFYYINLYDELPELTPLNIKFTSVPQFFNYRLNSEDVVIFCSETDNMVVWNGVSAPEEIIDAPKILSCAVHNERLFATTTSDPNMLWFSDDLDPTNWSIGLHDAGYIQMVDERGKLLRVVSFGGYLYVFRERGISRLTANGDQSEFYLGHCYVSSGEINASSIAVCGDRILFVASDGVYVFDGANTTRVLENLNDLIVVNDKLCAEFFNGKYYLSCKVNFGDDAYLDSLQDVNALISFDILNGEFNLYRGLNVQAMARVCGGSFNELAILCDDGLMCKSVLSLECAGKFKTGLYDFLGPGRNKTVRRVQAYVDGAGADIELVNEKNQVKVIHLRNGTNNCPTVFTGKKIGYVIKAFNGTEISDLVVEL